MINRLRLFVFAIFVGISFLAASAQDCITEKGYFYSPTGFTCKDGNIYTSDMKTLVKVGNLRRRMFTDAFTYDKPSDLDYFTYRLIQIPSGCEIMPAGMFFSPESKDYFNSSEFNGSQYCCLVIIPSSVKYISTAVFAYPALAFFSGESGPGAVESTAIDPDARELARFDIEGRRLAQPQKGVNIVLFSDGTARKVLVK